MSKIVSTKKINASFLAIVLIVGTFAALSPSFMIGAHAQQFNGMDQKYNNYEQDYGMNSYDNKQSYGKENSYYKSKDSSGNVIVKKIKCNNINANLNGFNGIEVGTLPTALRGLALDEAQGSDEGERGAVESDVGRPLGHESNSRFVCINNNDNTPVGEPISELCEECFAANSALQTEIIEALVDFEGSITFSGPSYVLAIGSGTNTIEQVCAIIESSAEFYGAPIPADVFDQVFTLLLTGEVDVELPALDPLIECLLEAGIIAETELPGSISANGLDSMNVSVLATHFVLR